MSEGRIYVDSASVHICAGRGVEFPYDKKRKLNYYDLGNLKKETFGFKAEQLKDEKAKKRLEKMREDLEDYVIRHEIK